MEKQNKNDKESKLKKAVLDDSASIYEKRNEDESAKKTWKELNGKDKVTFFRDYYLLKSIVCAALIGLFIYIGVVVFGPHTNQILSVAVLMDELDDTKINSMTKDLNSIMETDKHNIVSIDDTFYFTRENSSIAGDEKLTTILYTGSIDVIVTDQNYFKKYSYNGFLKNLDLYLPDDIKEALSDKLIEANFNDSDDYDKAFEDALTPSQQPSYNDGVPYVFGIDLSDCTKYRELHGYVEQPILTIAYNAKNKDNTFAFIRYLFDLPQK